MYSDFFFQAEDGIRCGHVTGVQTCALPICARCSAGRTSAGWVESSSGTAIRARRAPVRSTPTRERRSVSIVQPSARRSEERRVGIVDWYRGSKLLTNIKEHVKLVETD